MPKSDSGGVTTISVSSDSSDSINTPTSSTTDNFSEKDVSADGSCVNRFCDSGFRWIGRFVSDHPRKVLTVSCLNIQIFNIF